MALGLGGDRALSTLERPQSSQIHITPLSSPPFIAERVDAKRSTILARRRRSSSLQLRPSSSARPPQEATDTAALTPDVANPPTAPSQTGTRTTASPRGAPWPSPAPPAPHQARPPTGSASPRRAHACSRGKPRCWRRRSGSVESREVSLAHVSAPGNDSAEKVGVTPSPSSFVPTGRRSKLWPSTSRPALPALAIPNAPSPPSTQKLYASLVSRPLLPPGVPVAPTARQRTVDGGGSWLAHATPRKAGLRWRVAAVISRGPHASGGSWGGRAPRRVCQRRAQRDEGVDQLRAVVGSAAVPPG